MRTTVAVCLLALSGCAFSDPAPSPLNHDEVASMLKFSANHDELLETVRERGIEPMGAECIIDLKKAGASDDLLKELVKCERPRMSRAEAHARLHQQWGSSSAICGECGAWIRVR